MLKWKLGQKQGAWAENLEQKQKPNMDDVDVMRDIMNANKKQITTKKQMKMKMLTARNTAGGGAEPPNMKYIT